eukprot:499326-Hanusia_phi.AAC.6
MNDDGLTEKMARIESELIGTYRNQMRGEEDTRITMQNQETSYTTSSGSHPSLREVPEISSCPPLTLCFPDDTCNSYLVEGREYCFTAESPNSRGGSSDEDEYAHGIDEATLNDLGVPISPIVSEDSITNMVVNNFTLPPHAGGNVLFQTASRTSSIPSRTRSIPSGTSSIHRLGSNEESSSSDGEIEATSWSTTKLSHLNDSSLSYHDWVCAWGSAWGHSTSLQEQKRYEKRRMIKSKGRGEVQTCRKMKTSVGEKMQTKSVSAHQKERIKTIKSQLRKQINNSSTSIEASGIKTPRSIRCCHVLQLPRSIYLCSSARMTALQAIVLPSGDKSESMPLVLFKL